MPDLMKAGLKTLAHRLDLRLARSRLGVAPEGDSLTIVFFHSLLDGTAAEGNLDPTLAVTVAQFRECLEHLTRREYHFVSAADVAHGALGGKCAMVTFDDGYANNRLALPVAREYGAPVTIFLSTDHVRRGTSFWWDALYREGRRAGISSRHMARERSHLMKLTSRQIEDHLLRRFGPEALQPLSDADRPLTAEEVKSLAAEPSLHWGNHTRSHAILTNYPPAAIRDEVEAAGREINAMTGSFPLCLAYPSGAFSESVLAAVREAGVQTGMTSQPGRNSLPLSAASRLRLRRFPVRGHRDIGEQCELIASSRRPFSQALATLKTLRDGY